MKKFLLLPLFGLTIYGYAFLESTVLDFHHIFGRCSGSNAYCSACSDCSHCRHCAGNGGNCAVCYVPRVRVKRQPIIKGYKKARSADHQPSFKTNDPIATEKYSPDSHGNPKAKIYHQRTSDGSGSGLDFTKTSSAVNYVPKITNESVTIRDSLELNYDVEIPEDAEFVRVTASTANLRQQAGTKSIVLQKLRHGDLLIRLGTKKGWLKVQTLDSGEVGYVYENLLN